MDYNFDTWKKALDDFRNAVTKDLEEIRRHKEEVRQMKSEIFSALNTGYYLRDDHRIVISAPEIIIGNVDRDGILCSNEGSRVVVRAQDVNLEGVGDGGAVQTRAASIRQIAVNPGADGLEAVAGSLSEVVTQARSVVLEADKNAGVFSQIPASAGDGGVRIHADGPLSVEASVSSERKKKDLEDKIKELETLKSALEKEADGYNKAYGPIADSIKSLYEAQSNIFQDEVTLRTEVDLLQEYEEQIQSIAPAFRSNYDNGARAISRLAEVNRQISCLKKEKDTIKTGDAFKKESTGSSVSIRGERIDLDSRDGDGNLRDNAEAGVGIMANYVSVKALDKNRTLHKNGKVFVNAMNVELSTVNMKDLKWDDKGKLQSGTFATEGNVFVRSKTVTVEATDREVKDGKMEEKALTKDSTLNIRVEKTDLSATDTEGKATGSIALNAKEIAVRSMNVDKEKRTDDKLSEGSSMLLLSEKMYVGAKKKDIKSKKVQVVTEEAGIFANKTLELQQDEAKAVLQLSGGNAGLSGSKVQVFGATAITGKTEVKDELKAPKATIDNLEAKTSFKSSNISDGIAIPGAPASGSLSAKLKAEDAPDKK
jgi:hypothetical protein